MGKLELECVETDRCILQEYRLVCPVEAGVIPGLTVVSTGVRYCQQEEGIWIWMWWNVV